MIKTIKQLSVVCLLVSLSGPLHAEESWWQQLLTAVGLSEPAEETEAVEEVENATQAKAESGLNIGAIDASGMLSMLTENLGVSAEQAQGGLAALLSVAKQNISEEQFAALSEQIPGLDALMRYVPVVSGNQQEGMGGLLSLAGNYNEQLGQLSDLKQQFGSLGLDASMIPRYMDQANLYLSSEEGAEAKKLLSESLGTLSLDSLGFGG